jgi:anaerobic selenocysteine-containing dehydrogenase
MLVTLDGDRALRVSGDPDHEFTAGFLCHKMARYTELVYHPERLRHPLRRVGPKGSGQFERISWDAALDEIARRFRDISAGPHGPQAILPYSYCGTMGKLQSSSLDRRFFHRLGASKLDRTICATAGAAGYSYTIGNRTGMAPEGFRESRLIINWGSNTAVTNSHLWAIMVESRKHGAKIITIDPYRCRTAERSHWHIAPKVGTDAALALGMMHVIFRDRLADEDYLTRLTLGHEELRGRALRDYGPDRVAKITGLDVTTIERLAHEYATTQPSAIRVNYGLQRHRGGGMAVRTIACLPAVVGAWRHFGGGVLLSTSSMYPLNTLALERPDLSPPDTRTINMSQLADALLTSPRWGEGSGVRGGPSVSSRNARASSCEAPAPLTPALSPGGEKETLPIKALFVYNSNPAAIAPDHARVRCGLLRDDLFVVVHDLFQTDTADYADIVLPATSQLEHFDLHTSYGHHWIQVNQPAIAPLAESRCNTWVFRQLAARLEFEPDLFQVSDVVLAREALWETSPPDSVPAAVRGITLDRLIADGPQRLRLPERFTPFGEGNFPTPSGKCEFLCKRLSAAGLDPLPTYIPPAESSDADPELASRFPLQLLSPPSPHFLNSTFVNVDSLRNAAKHPELEIHPTDAAARGIRHGDTVRVFNSRGHFTAVAVVGDTVRRDVVVAPSIWWNKFTDGGANANATTSSRLTDMGGGATFFDNLVEVSPLASEGGEGPGVRGEGRGGERL